MSLSSVSCADETSTVTLINWKSGTAPSYVPITVTIKDDIQLTFMLDTAAAHSSISTDIAKKYKLIDENAESVKIANVAGNVSVDVTHEMQVALKGSHVKQKYRFDISHPISGSFPPGVTGLIGKDLLAGAIVKNDPNKGLTITFANTQLNCGRYEISPECQKLYDYKAVIKGMWRGQKADFWIDTGAITLENSVMLGSEDSSLFWYENHTSLPTINIAEVSQLPLRYMIETNVTFNDEPACPLISFIKDPEDGSFKTDELTFLLGMEYLKNLPFKIDYGNLTTDFSAAKCSKFRINTTGITNFHYDPETPDKLEVRRVDTGSPAWLGGIRAGDFIVGLDTSDGRYITDFGDEFSDSFDVHITADEGSKLIFYILRAGKVFTKRVQTKEYQRLK